MNLKLLFIAFLLSLNSYTQVHTTYLWHMHQPTYWGEVSQQNTNRYQLVKESQDMKLGGQNTYADGLAHPLNNLEEIFGLPDRVNAYQYQPKNAVQSIMGNAKAGAQMTYGGSLIENLNSLGASNQWGYSNGWKNDVNTAHAWQTSGGKTRLDVMGFTMHHTLSPLVSDEVLKKEIQAHKHYQTQQFGYYSNGYWAAEAAFSERIIKVLKEEGFEWTVVANSHLARTLADYPLVFGTNGCNIDPPNLADKVTTTGVNWHNGQIDGRGGQFAAPYCFTPHKAKYVDPETGSEYKITIVPMAELDSYRDGFSQQGTNNIDTNIAPYADANRPPLVLLAHDGDNAWGGGASYYGEAVPGFTNSTASAGYVPTTIEQYLSDFIVPENDVVKVEDGSWFNAANDWGSPQFINWFWPLNMSNDKSKFNPNGWTEDVRNMAVLYAGENYCIMAEHLEGGVDIADIVNPTASSGNAEKAWHFLLPGYDSGNAYYGLALDLEIKATLAVNRAIERANATISAHPNIDNTKPSVLTPQRYPYNPGNIGFGPNYGYQQMLNDADFAVWTLAFDVSDVQSAVLKYRVDVDGVNILTSNQNETYVGGVEVGNWISLDMIEKIIPKDNVTNNPEVSFFILPYEIANLYYAYINGISNKLLDYYVEVTDTKGNITKTKIQHVWVGENINVNPTLTFNPEITFSENPIDVTITASDSSDPNPVIYYTTDGTTPSLSSTSAVSSVTVPITTTTTFKAFAIDNEGNQSDLITKTYTIGDVPTFTVYFKPPLAWNGLNPKIHYWNAVPSGSVANTSWPGLNMQPLCEGWYSYTFDGVSNINIIFNNGNGGVGTNQTPDLTVSAEAWYEWGTGWLSTAPNISFPCLSITPQGGNFSTGQNIPVSLTAIDTAENGVNIYYTIDGSEPTSASNYFVNNGSININSTTTLKAFAQNEYNQSSSIQTYTYNFTNSGITVYFKPDPAATGWNGITPKVYYWNVVGGSIPATSWPGVTMQTHENDWFKYTFPNVTSLNVLFNNGNSGVGTNQTPDITNVTTDIWYTWGIGLGVENSEILILNLFPNPSNGMVYIQSDINFETFECYDGTGRIVKKDVIIENKIDLSNLKSGVYILNIERNRHIYRKKLILE